MNQELAFPGTDDGRTVEEFDAQIKAENAGVAKDHFVDANEMVEAHAVPVAPCCGHASDCAVHNAPALPVWPCDCGFGAAPAAPVAQYPQERATSLIRQLRNALAGGIPPTPTIAAADTFLREVAAAPAAPVAQGEPLWSTEECDRVLKTLRYLIGIAERGEGRPMRDDETVEAFALAYVQRLEAVATAAPAAPVAHAIGTEWRPCVKLPITVHVREQRPGESHISTREGITPVRPDDLIMRGVAGEEYPIGRELFERTYRLGEATPAPAAQEGSTS